MDLHQSMELFCLARANVLRMLATDACTNEQVKTKECQRPRKQRLFLRTLACVAPSEGIFWWALRFYQGVPYSLITQTLPQTRTRNSCMVVRARATTLYDPWLPCLVCCQMKLIITLWVASYPGPRERCVYSHRFNISLCALTWKSGV